jgi:branched-subunit amino acid aminotransferase/4-amino-4-deoxychorismate lyase
LLVGPDGEIAEGAITNIGFVEAGGVIWPSAPALRGISMQLIEAGLAEKGIASERRRVTLSDLPTLEAAFLTNSQGIVAVARIDEARFPVHSPIIEAVTEVYERAPWDPA